jgi:hypothetical protein
MFQKQANLQMNGSRIIIASYDAAANVADVIADDAY